MLFQGKVEVVEETDREVRTVSLSIRIPSVLRLRHYIHSAHKKNLIRFSRINIFIRDQYRCQYCGERFSKSHLTLDHIVPVVQGGAKNWENIVSACKPCNQQKGGRTPQQANMRLFRKPTRPQWLPTTQIQMSIAVTPEPWKPYLDEPILEVFSPPKD